MWVQLTVLIMNAYITNNAWMIFRTKMLERWCLCYRIAMNIITAWNWATIVWIINVAYRKRVSSITPFTTFFIFWSTLILSSWMWVFRRNHTHAYRSNNTAISIVSRRRMSCQPVWYFCQLLKALKLYPIIIILDQSEYIEYLEISMCECEHCLISENPLHRLPSNELVSVIAMDLGIKNALFDDWLIYDGYLVALGGLFIMLCMWKYTNSLFITMMTLIANVFSLGISYFVYTCVLELPFFPFMNLLAVIVMIGKAPHTISNEWIPQLMSFLMQELVPTTHLFLWNCGTARSSNVWNHWVYRCRLLRASQQMHRIRIRWLDWWQPHWNMRPHRCW